MLATYTVGQLRAADPLVGGTDTIEVTGPVGTQFPNTATLEDATTPSASQTLTLRQGLASNDIVYNLTANVAAGDVVTLVMTGVINPAGTPVGSTDTLVLGADNATSNTTAAGLQGLATVVSTPTTTTTAPTTTTTPVLHAVVAATTAKATVLGKTVKLQLRCSVASCQGLITLTDVRTVVATAKYSLAVGKTGTVSVTLDSQGLQFLAHAPSHSLTLRESVTVTGGTTAQRKITVSAPAVPVIAALTAEATVAAKTVKLELRCTVARCQGVITLTDVRTLLAAATYSLAAGKTGTVPVTLGSQGLQLLGHAPGHILKLNETVTVTGGTTVQNKITVAG